VSFVHDLFLGEQHVHMFVALAPIDLLDYLQPQLFPLIYRLRPVPELEPVLGSHNLVQNLLSHLKLYFPPHKNTTSGTIYFYLQKNTLAPEEREIQS
jgi:hypothetical protein